MIAALHRQLNSYGHSFWFYCVLSAFALGLGVLVSMFHGIYQYANFEYVLSYLTVFFALLLPIFTVSTMQEERKKGVAGFLSSLPISARTLVIGKLLAMLLILVILTAVLLFVPVLLGMFGTVYYPSAYMAVLAFFLFGVAMLALDGFLALCLKNKWAALAATYAVTGALVILSYLSASTTGILAEILAKLSLFGAYAPFVFGIVDLDAVVLYLSVGALFTVLTLLLSRKLTEE